MMNDAVLNSWKEIAAYMGRGVRTVQRWEQELGLPVRRPRGKERSAVIALKPDLDRWLHNVPQGHPITASADEHHVKLHLNTERLVERTHQILERSTRMQEVVRTTLALASRLREQHMENVRAHGAKTEPQKVLLAKTATLTEPVYDRGGPANS